MLEGDPSEVDERTDVYLLGATLHHILTGEYGTRGNTIAEVLEEARVSKPYAYDYQIPKILADLANQACHPNPAIGFKVLRSLEKVSKKFWSSNKPMGLVLAC